ncbi:hypothetical protein F2Q70_00025742 [Brassica cretica]|uniref:Uncharacterized protein n=1 Tax=Brassica cretica TaxID=69181 RepID=A0A8S9LGH5_BRACR|nr:hypothetical protein F2Q70_00025742 [Brassica cretica]
MSLGWTRPYRPYWPYQEDRPNSLKESYYTRVKAWSCALEIQASSLLRLSPSPRKCVVSILSPRFSKLFTSSCFKMDSGMKMKVAVVFKGDNYLVWSRMVRNAVGSKGLWGHITSGEAPKLIAQEEDKDEASRDPAQEGGTSDGKSLVAYIGTPKSRNNNDQDFIRKSDIDALIKMLKDNATPTSDHGGERSEPETTQESGASGIHDQDVELSEQQDGAEASQPEEEVEEVSLPPQESGEEPQVEQSPQPGEVNLLILKFKEQVKPKINNKAQTLMFKVKMTQGEVINMEVRKLVKKVRYQKKPWKRM